MNVQSIVDRPSQVMRLIVIIWAYTFAKKIKHMVDRTFVLVRLFRNLRNINYLELKRTGKNYFFQKNSDLPKYGQNERKMA